MKIFVFEGMDGSGKTTTVQAVATELQNLGFKVKTVCWLYDGIERDAVGRAAWYLRRMGDWHKMEMPRLALEQYDYVLMDRSWISTLIYQGYLSKNQAVTNMISQTVIKNCVYSPTLVFRLSVPVDEALVRIQDGRGELGEHETPEQLSDLERIYQSVLPAFLRSHKIPMVVLPRGTVEKVRDTAIDHIVAMLQPSFFNKPVEQV